MPNTNQWGIAYDDPQYNQKTQSAQIGKSAIYEDAQGAKYADPSLNTGIYKTSLPRISPSGGSSSLDVANTNLDKADLLGSKTKDEIRSEELARRKEIIDAANANYDTAIKGEQHKGEVREGGLRALASTLGLMGSPTAFGMSRANKDQTNEAVAYQEKLRAAALSQIYNNVNTTVDELYKAELEQNESKLKTARENASKAGQDALTALAASFGKKGITSYDDIKGADSTNELAKIQKALGYTDYQMKYAWNQALPTEYKPITKDYYTPGKDANTSVHHFLTIDPITGKTSETTQDVKAPYSMLQANNPTIKDEKGNPLYYDASKGGYFPINQESEFKEIGTDSFGNKQYGFVNTKTGTITPANINGTQTTPQPGTQTPINIFGIKATSTTTGLGGTDSGVKSSDGGTFLASQGEAKDTEIAKKLLTSDIYSGLTIDEALKKWSNNGYGAEAVAGVLNPNAKIGSLNDSELNMVLDGIKKREGVAPKTQSTSMYDDFLADKTDEQKTAFNAIPEGQKGNVISLLNGDILLSDLARGMKGSDTAKALNNLAKSIDPTFSENVNKQRYTFKVKWNDTNGKAYQTRTGLNTAMLHLATIKNLTDQLSSNGDFKKANSLKNFIAENINTPGLAETIGQLKDTVHLLATEIARAYKGGVPDKDEIQAQEDSINENSPTNVLKAIINNKAQLMAGKAESDANEYKKVFGEYPVDSIIQPDVIKTLKGAGVDTTGLDKIVAKSVFIPSNVKNTASKKGYSEDELRNAIFEYGINQVKSFLGL